jgi:hypothetical protein
MQSMEYKHLGLAALKDTERISGTGVLLVWSTTRGAGTGTSYMQIDRPSQSAQRYF